MDLGGKPAAGTSQPVVGRLDVYSARFLPLQVPLWHAPAACWWARQMVESTLTCQVINPCASAWACNRVRICFQVPSRCHRRNNP
jgi:hypothetical protein